jgi:hypothetical protein
MLVELLGLLFDAFVEIALVVGIDHAHRRTVSK